MLQLGRYSESHVIFAKLFTWEKRLCNRKRSWKYIGRQRGTFSASSCEEFHLGPVEGFHFWKWLYNVYICIYSWEQMQETGTEQRPTKNLLSAPSHTCVPCHMTRAPSNMLFQASKLRSGMLLAPSFFWPTWPVALTGMDE